MLLAAVAIALAACGPSRPVATPASLDVGDAVIAAESRLLDAGTGKLADGDAAPDFSYTLPDGTVQKLSDLRGKQVVVNFWATWCLPCIEEMPELQRVYDSSSGAVVVLGVNRNELPEAIARFVPTVGVTFPLIADATGAIGDRYSVTSLPTTFFINSDGTIGARQIGALSASVLEERLKALR
ncbi:MAG: TlpA disulfide reductase family protein [Chloroflexi bacterium OHK40]